MKNRYRNTSLSFTRGVSIAGGSLDDGDFLGIRKNGNNNHYYVSDFLFKISENNNEKYFVMDAKYTSVWKIKKNLISELVYKYIFSLSPQNESVSIVGMGVFSGICKDEITESIFDSPVKYRPSTIVDLIPLSEEMSANDQNNNISQL